MHLSTWAIQCGGYEWADRDRGFNSGVTQAEVEPTLKRASVIKRAPRWRTHHREVEDDDARSLLLPSADGRS